MNHYIAAAIAAGTAALLAAAPAHAQSDSYKDTGYSAYANILSAFDDNNDGRLSRGEFAQGGAGDFDAIDLDGDGFLDDGELSTWQQGYVDELKDNYEAQN